MDESSNIRINSRSRKLAILNAKRNILKMIKRKNKELEDIAIDSYCDSKSSHR